MASEERDLSISGNRMEGKKDRSIMSLTTNTVHELIENE